MCLEKTPFKNRHNFNTLPKHSVNNPTLFFKGEKVKDESQLSDVYPDLAKHDPCTWSGEQ